jgi:5-methylthioadenosine/S-adenosylhomocysteine deaminase
MKLASGPAPLPAFKAAGIVVGLGSDGGISNNSLSLWEGMKMGSLLQKVTHLDATALGAGASFEGKRYACGGLPQRSGQIA